ncbi:hypothetical protein FOCG_17726 [Fusarium oxysporum f. sp. radicis-lycopersici 26381]|nr:hypothetical protein FOCG_17726 [Fusarium oxysporum f. sp. radicis-lycopersici 26381]
MAASIILILHANDKAIDSWLTETRSIRLSVVLAISLTIGTAALRTLVREGITVSFWVKVQKNPSLRKVRQQWAHGWSSLDALLRLRHPNKFTVPSILMIGIVAVALLFQRAVEVHVVSEFVPKTFTVAVSPDQFNQPTAYYMTRANAVSALTSSFSGVVQDYTNRNPITGLSVKDCHGTCAGVLTGPGFDVSCTRLRTNYDLSFDNLNPGDTAHIDYITISAEGPQTPSIIRLLTMYKGSPDTKGKPITTNCTLRSAQVKYPFTYANGTTTLNGTSSSVDGTVNRTISLLTVDREAPGLNRALYE